MAWRQKQWKYKNTTPKCPKKEVSSLTSAYSTYFLNDHYAGHTMSVCAELTRVVSLLEGAIIWQTHNLIAAVPAIVKLFYNKTFDSVFSLSVESITLILLIHILYHDSCLFVSG